MKHVWRVPRGECPACPVESSRMCGVPAWVGVKITMPCGVVVEERNVFIRQAAIFIHCGYLLETMRRASMQVQHYSSDLDGRRPAYLNDHGVITSANPAPARATDQSPQAPKPPTSG